MIPAKMKYIDRNGVSITNFTLRVKKQAYPIKDILGYSQSIVSPGRIPGFLSVMIGFAIVMFSFSSPVSAQSSLMEFGGKFLSANVLVLYVGIFLLFAGIMLTMMTKEKYALIIVTATGAKMAIISDKKRYVNRIKNVLTNIFKDNGYVNNYTNFEIKSEPVTNSEGEEYYGRHLAGF